MAKAFFKVLSSVKFCAEQIVQSVLSVDFHPPPIPSLSLWLVRFFLFGSCCFVCIFHLFFFSMCYLLSSTHTHTKAHTETVTQGAHTVEMTDIVFVIFANSSQQMRNDNKTWNENENENEPTKCWKNRFELNWNWLFHSVYQIGENFKLI